MAKGMDRLTLDAMAAKQAGMSYGKWKAAHPHTEYTETQIDETGRRCIVCGARLCGHRRFYCSELCGKKEYYRRKKERKGIGNGI